MKRILSLILLGFCSLSTLSWADGDDSENNAPDILDTGKCESLLDAPATPEDRTSALSRFTNNTSVGKTVAAIGVLAATASELLAKGGDLIGNGGGGAELLLRISLNRFNQHARALQLSARGELLAPIAALLESNPAESLKSRLVFSESKFEACLSSGGIVVSGLCAALDASDHNLYISTARLYTDTGESLITKENAVARIADVLLQKNRIEDPIRSEVRDQLQSLSQKSWVEVFHPDHNLRHLTVMYIKNSGSLAFDMIIGDGSEYYRVADLIRDRDPCALAGSKLSSFALHPPIWQGTSLYAHGMFNCANGRILLGNVSIQINPKAIEIQYIGLND